MTSFPIFEGSVGAALIAVTLFTLWKRAKSDQSIDDRVIRQLDERDETIRELKHREEALLDRNRQTNDRLYEMMQKSVELATTHGQEVMRAVETVRKDNHDTAHRLHVRLEQTNAILDATRVKLEDCEVSHARCEERMDRVEETVLARMPPESSTTT